MTGPARFRPNQTLGRGKEFDTIRALMERWGDLVADIGDDAAALPAAAGVQVISTDAFVEDVHFRTPWITPREVGARAAAAALSDLAAMGAAAGQVLVAFVVPEWWDDHLLEVADGLAGPIRAAGASIVGGNLSRGPAFGITLTVIGDAARPVPRNGARVGDVVVVTGQLGGPRQAIESWERGEQPAPWARSRFAAPSPRLAAGQRLAQAGATSMIDVSDGLAADARHLGAASGVTLRLDAGLVPRGPGVSTEQALVSGEEYELLATLPADAAAQLLASWDVDVPITIIGHVDQENDLTNDPSGHDHFAKPVTR